MLALQEATSQMRENLGEAARVLRLLLLVAGFISEGEVELSEGLVEVGQREGEHGDQGGTFGLAEGRVRLLAGEHSLDLVGSSEGGRVLGRIAEALLERGCLVGGERGRGGVVMEGDEYDVCHRRERIEKRVRRLFTNRANLSE